MASIRTLLPSDCVSMQQQLNTRQIEPLISLTIRDRDQVFQAGDTLEYEFQIDAVEEDEVQSVEASVLWYTEGKGGEDLGVHDFRRLLPADVEDSDLRQLQRITVTLPNSPLSYDGIIVKLHWCVRVRVFLRRGKEALFEQPFRLGNVPAAQLETV